MKKIFLGKFNSIPFPINSFKASWIGILGTTVFFLEAFIIWFINLKGKLGLAESCISTFVNFNFIFFNEFQGFMG